MSVFRKSLSYTSAAVGLLLVVGNVGAQAAPDSDRRPERRSEARALADAVRRVERETGGEVLSAERVPFDGRDVSRVKVVDHSGRVRSIYMDDAERKKRPKPVRTRGDDAAND